MTRRYPSIMVLGSINVDIVMRCASLPKPGETAAASGIDVRTGGKGANQAVAAARLGASVGFIGCVGSDQHGRQARERLDAEGVDARHVSTVKGPTGAATVWVEQAGQNAILVAQGANAALSTDVVDRAASAIQNAAVLVCQLEVPLPAVRRACDIASAAGVSIILNPAPAPSQALPAELLQQVDLLVPNQSEACSLLGVTSSDGTLGPAETAAGLHGLGVRHLLLTLGRQGVHLSTAGYQRNWQGMQVPVVDTTGAGDTFIGAFAAAASMGSSLFDAISLANEAAAFSVGRHGTMDSMPRRSDVAWPLAPHDESACVSLATCLDELRAIA